VRWSENLKPSCPLGSLVARVLRKSKLMPRSDLLSGRPPDRKASHSFRLGVSPSELSKLGGERVLNGAELMPSGTLVLQPE
jgi:hypothetical protein